jgi:DNA primase
MDAIDMLAERQLLWLNVDWHYANTPLQFKRRVILPYQYKDTPVGYAARYIGDPPEGTSKYIVKKPEHFVFNLDAQGPEREFVIVTEGDFDALSLDGTSVGTNSIDEQQASLLSQLHRRVIVLPDADAAGMKMVEAALEHGFDVSFPDWMDTFKDANGAASFYGRAFTLASVRDSAISNPTKARVLAKRYCID